VRKFLLIHYFWLEHYFFLEKKFAGRSKSQISRYTLNEKVLFEHKEIFFEEQEVFLEINT
jgi:hypothetical protein